MRPRYTTVLCAVEGESEKGYVRWLNLLAQNQKVFVSFKVELIGGGDPFDLIGRAIELKETKKRCGAYFNHYALVFDTDRLGVNREKDPQALAFAKRKNLVLVRQEPCHEALLVRHFSGYETRQPPNKRESTRMLRESWPEYREGLDALSYESVFNESHLRCARSVEPDLDALLKMVGWP
ncbi:MAG: hypothetical protein IT565_05495 [Rhodospirillales bacterium]|nr:hypothetical protein [Rhodospirillales bacterium]